MATHLITSRDQVRPGIIRAECTCGTVFELPTGAANAAVKEHLNATTQAAFDDRIAAHPVAAALTAYHDISADLCAGTYGADGLDRYAAAETALTAALDADGQERADLLTEREVMRQLVSDVVTYARRMVDDETLDRDTAVMRILVRLDVLED